MGAPGEPPLPPLPPLLLLWDIDGTLLLRASREHGQALRRALEAVHGVSGLDGVRVEAAGRTDLAIARDLLAQVGVGPQAFDRLASEVRVATAHAYQELCPRDLSPAVAPGVGELLAELARQPGAYRLSLTTGNFEPVARLKLARAGLGGWFAPGQGGFGSDAEERAELPPIARGRAGDGQPWPRERTVVIGDTPRDIACARADGLRAVAVATGPYGAEELGEADAVVDDARALAPVLAAWT